MKVRHVNHLGINVEDLEGAKDFFSELGFSVMGKSAMEGKLLDEVTGLKGAQTELIMLQSPDEQFCIEVVKYIRPAGEKDEVPAKVNAHGFNHLAFEVDDLDGIVKSLEEKGFDLVGSVQSYENVWKICYVHGPEGIIVELAEKL